MSFAARISIYVWWFLSSYFKVFVKEIVPGSVSEAVGGTLAIGLQPCCARLCPSPPLACPLALPSWSLAWCSSKLMFVSTGPKPLRPMGQPCRPDALLTNHRVSLLFPVAGEQSRHPRKVLKKLSEKYREQAALCPSADLVLQKRDITWDDPNVTVYSDGLRIFLYVNSYRIVKDLGISS